MSSILWHHYNTKTRVVSMVPFSLKEVGSNEAVLPMRRA
jgi:hypothetical protein